MSTLRRLHAFLPVLALGAIALTGCGSDDGKTKAEPTPSSSAGSTGSSSGASGTPACTDVWADGATLPHRYTGCSDDSGDLVKPRSIGCESGQRIVTYDDRFYAVPGGTVHQADTTLEKDRDYRAALMRCRA